MIRLNKSKSKNPKNSKHKQVADSLGQAIQLHQSGDLESARCIYENLHKLEPKNSDVIHLLGLVAFRQNQSEKAYELIKRALAIQPHSAVYACNLAAVLMDLSRYDEALEQYNKAITINPKYEIALYDRGNVLFELRRFHEAIESYGAAIQINPNFASAVHNRGVALLELGLLPEAIESFSEAIKLKPNYAYAFNNRGAALKRLGRNNDALEDFDRAIKIQPNYVEALNNRGNVLSDLKQYHEALRSYNAAIKVNPNYAEAFNNRGSALTAIKLYNEGLASFFEAIRLKPSYSEAFNNAGITLHSLKRYDEALDCYDKALAIKPDYAKAFSNRGFLLFELQRLDESLVCYGEAIRLNPTYADAYNNLGFALMELKEFEKALQCFNEVVCLEPEYPFMVGNIALLRCRMCMWDGLDEILSDISDGIRSDRSMSQPFALITLVDDPVVHRLAAEKWVKEKISLCEILPPFLPRIPDAKIHIAYISADFHDHATAYLMAELFESHDRSRFEITAISFGPDLNTTMRERIVQGFDRFEDVRHMSDRDVARYCRELRVDIAVDLKGYTQNSRPGILAERCAPIQINWLGYPGTLAAPFIDYIVADRMLISHADFSFYSEKVLWLPDSYQVNDSKRKISEREFSRTDFGLPETVFVFCCFNNNYKILPATFDVWMRILKRVPGSVLWLLKDNATAARNLQIEATKRGVDPSRLVFAERMPLDEHLARHRLADLFLDTWPCNAHTTASDALWAELPLLTRSGRSFAARVAASLLAAVGLDDLITSSDHDYEELAVALAMDKERLYCIRTRLSSNRHTYPLFDCERFTKHLESAYQRLIDNKIKIGDDKHSDSIGDSIVINNRQYQIRDQDTSQVKKFYMQNANNGFQYTQNKKVTNTLLSDQIYFNKSISEEKNELNSVVSKIDRPTPIPVVINESINDGNEFEILVGLKTRIEIMDIGAACIAEVPVYKKLIDRGVAHLHAFEGDERQIPKIKETYGTRVSLYPFYLYDGSEQTVHVAHAESGMTSVLMPKERSLKFFNGFEYFGRIISKEKLKTYKLNEISGVPFIDFLKMDIQGAELTVLKHGLDVLSECVAIQLEVSFFCLYENQPSFGDIDVWMRENGFVPHCFVDIKRWSITPTIRNNNFRIPFNQLLEADIVYIRDPLNISEWPDEQIKKLALIAHECFSSTDLALYLLIELERRHPLVSSESSLTTRYLSMLNQAPPT